MATKSMKVVFGAMTIGKPGIEMTRVFTLEDTNALLSTFQSYGHNEVDTARVYGEGSSEEYLGQLDWKSKGIVMDTKLYPTEGKGPMFKDAYSHRPEDVRRGLMESLKALGTDKIDMFYLHGPDRSVPFEDTLREVNELYKEGKFSRFGISNYYSFEVAQICETCKRNGWIMPAVYQGLYNALHRKVEDELVPCLRQYGISLYCFNPLAGGFLTGKFKRDQDDEDVEAGGRFDPKRLQGQLHRGRYWNDAMFDAIDVLKPVAEKHGLTESQCALRWLTHHSMMSNEKGDAVIIGASSTKHLNENLKALDEGPLPEEVVEALNLGWERIRGPPLKYWH